MARVPTETAPLGRGTARNLPRTGTFAAVRVLANGKTVELAPGASLVDLLDALGLGARWVVAERNGEAVPRARMASTVLQDGDRIELVKAVAGG